jgi:uncharacterized protein YkwD
MVTFAPILTFKTEREFGGIDMKKGRLLRLSALLFAFMLSISLLSMNAFAVDGSNETTKTESAAATELTEEEQAILDFKEEVIRLVNIERENEGVPALTEMDTLAGMADIRAEESAASFSHTRPDGTRCFTLFAEYSLKYRAAGENLAYGFKTPEAVVKAWMNSEGHKKNILDPDFTYIGIGYYVNENGRIYCSQFFYTPKAA